MKISGINKMNALRGIGIGALLTVFLAACWSRTPVNASAGHSWSGGSQEALALRLDALGRYESWLWSHGFLPHETVAFSSASGGASVNWSSDRYVGQFPELGAVEVLIEKRDLILRFDRSKLFFPKLGPDFYIHLRAEVRQTQQSEDAWQRLLDEAKTLVRDGHFEPH